MSAFLLKNKLQENEENYNFNEINLKMLIFLKNKRQSQHIAPVYNEKFEEEEKMG